MGVLPGNATYFSHACGLRASSVELDPSDHFDGVVIRIRAAPSLCSALQREEELNKEINKQVRKRQNQDGRLFTLL